MQSQQSWHTRMIALALAALMVATRTDHFGTPWQLPDASLAVFFLAGFYLASVWSLAGFLALAGFVDYAVIAFGGVSAFCVSPAYLFLIPAFGLVWLAGRGLRARSRAAGWTPIVGVASVVFAAFAYELVASGSFYFLSNRFAETSVMEFGARLIQYFPYTLAVASGYLALAAVIHWAASGLRRMHPQPESA